MGKEEGRRGKHTETGKCINTINIHRTTPTNPLPTTPSKREGGVNLILNPNQRIQHHRARLIQIQSIRLHTRFGRGLVRVPAVDVERLDLGVWSGRWFFDGAGSALGGHGGGLVGVSADGGDGCHGSHLEAEGRA